MTRSDSLAGIEVHEVGPRRFSACNLGDAEERDVLYGGQLLAQSIMAASHLHPDSGVRSIHAFFARTGRVSGATEYVAEPMAAGRVIASETITAMQGDRLCCRSLVLLDAGDATLLAHEPSPPAVGAPEDAVPGQEMLAHPGCEVRVVGGFDTWDPDAPTGPAELQVWLRWPHGSVGGAASRGLLAYATDGFLIGTAMRPYPGVGQDLAHSALSTGVLAHSITFHAPFDAGSWMLMAFDVPYAGHGRIHGRGQVFQNGLLVASLSQESIVRALEPKAGATTRTKM
ncbi:MAG: acyl-CoA thioesterase [Frankiales bacterium]|nr:acyl-CoA thioesterase [Frankiales bacterium]